MIKTIKYTEYIELSKKFFDNDDTFKNKVLVAKYYKDITDDYVLDPAFYLTRGVDFTDYCLLDEMLVERGVFSRTDLRTDLDRSKENVHGFIITKPSRIFKNGGVKTFNNLTFEKFISERFQIDVIKGISIENASKGRDGYSVTNSWSIRNKLCYDIATQEIVDLVKSYNSDFKINVGDKIPPVTDDPFIDIEIIDFSVLFEKLEEAKRIFIKHNPKTYSDE